MTKHDGNWLALLLATSMTWAAAGCGGGGEESVEPEKPATPAGPGTTSDDTPSDPTTAATPTTGTPDPEPGNTPDDTPSVTTNTPTTPPETPSAEPTDTSAGPATAEATVLAVVDALQNEQPQRVWQLLPASYQKEVNGLVHSFAAKMPADAWSRGFGLLQKTLGILKDKKDFVLSYPLLAFLPIDPEEISEPYDDTVAVLTTLATSDISDIEKLKTSDMGALIENVGGSLQKQFAAISAKTPEDPYKNQMMKAIGSTKVKTLESTDDTAKLEITSLNREVEFNADTMELDEKWVTKVEEVEFVKVEGRWIPKDMHDEFPQKIAEAKSALGQLTPEMIAQGSQMVLGVIDQVEPSIDAIAAAKTQNEFDVAVGMLVQQLQALSSGLGGPGAPGGPGFEE